MSEQIQSSGPRGLGLSYVLYQQIASVIGAFALIAYFGHFIAFDWRGALADLIGVWDSHVRPAVKWLLNETVVALAWRAFHVEIVLSPAQRDYLAAGLVLVFSVLRAQYWEEHRLGRTFLQTLGSLARDWAFTPVMIVAWPLAVLVLLAVAVLGTLRAGDPRWRLDGTFSLLSLAPFLYLALLLAANYFLQKSGA
jgi:hypothetical protein